MLQAPLVGTKTAKSALRLPSVHDQRRVMRLSISISPVESKRATDVSILPLPILSMEAPSVVPVFQEVDREAMGLQERAQRFKVVEHLVVPRSRSASARLDAFAIASIWMVCVRNGDSKSPSFR
jgi:hypothetical protein